MVRKKSDLKMKIYNESLSRGKNIYTGKKIFEKKEKKRPTSSYQLKKSKDTQLVAQKKKTSLGLLSYNIKSAQY